MTEPQDLKIGKKIIDISQLVDVFEAQEGVIEQIIGKTGNGKTYEGTRRAVSYLKQGYVVYTTWRLILPEFYDERTDLGKLLMSFIFFWRKKFYKFPFRENWHFLDIDRPDLIEFVAGLTDCIVFLDEGQDIFDSYEGRGMSQMKRKSLTRTRHLRKTLIIISQRAQAVAVTARANVQFFYKCVKTRAFYWPFATYFKIYRTEEMDNNNFPIWEDLMTGWRAELWRSHFANKKIFNSYNSWYLRAGIPKSQELKFEAYKLSIFSKIKAMFIIFFTKPPEDKPIDVDSIEKENKEKFDVLKTVEIKEKKPRNKKLKESIPLKEPLLEPKKEVIHNELLTPIKIKVVEVQ